MSEVVGRKAELHAVEAFLDRAEPGPTTLAIVGEPGIGKTTLWRHAVAAARARDSIVLVTRPAESEARLSFAGLTDLLSTVASYAFESLPAPQRAALDVVLLRASASRAPARRLVGTALLSLLRVVAADATIVIAIDDLQWLDVPSAATLEFALRRAGEPVGAIFSVRADAAEHSLVGSLDRDGHVQRLELGPMSVAALHRVLVQELGRHIPRPTLVRIATASKGNPLYAVEIARAMAVGDDLRRVADLPVPASLNSLVAARVRSLSPGTRDALLRVAALAKPDLQLVDAEALASAEDAGLVQIGSDGRVEFVHPLFASAVYTSASGTRRRMTHRALASIVGDPEERARHAALACAGRNERVSMEVEAAARVARMRGAPDTAAELTELALQLLPEGNVKAEELRFALAEHLYLASDFQRSLALLEDLCVELEPSDLRAQVLLTRAEIVYWRSGETAALTLAEEALADARAALVRARCHVAVAMYAGTVALPKAAAAARAAVDLLEPLAHSDPGLAASALGAKVRADLFLGRGFDAETAMQALAYERAAPPATVDTRTVFRLGQWLRYVDDFDGARERLRQAEEQARDEGDDSSFANILLNRVILETWSGALVEAAELAEQMVDAFAQQGLRAEGPNVWQVYVDAFAGRFEAVRAAAAAVDPQEPVVKALWQRTTGLAELAAGEPDAADRHLSEALAGFDRIHFREPAVWRIDGDAIEVALVVGNVEKAKARLVRFEDCAQRSGIPWSLAVSRRCRGLVHAAEGELEAANRLMEEALVEHERCPMPFEQARTLLAHGQVLRRLKRKRFAREALDEAGAIFVRIGADPWLRRVDDELRRVAVRQAPHDLSPTERQIARLAAEGLTNRAIAERAFVSVKTVETNLKRAYRKLGISSRAQLAHALDREDTRAIS